jgi:hypothetical protein
MLPENGKHTSPNIANVVQNVVVFMDGRVERHGGRGGQSVLTDTHYKVFAWLLKHGTSKARRLLYTPLLSPGNKLKRLKKALEHDTDLDV